MIHFFLGNWKQLKKCLLYSDELRNRQAGDTTSARRMPQPAQKTPKLEALARLLKQFCQAAFIVDTLVAMLASQNYKHRPARHEATLIKMGNGVKVGCQQLQDQCDER